MDMTPQAWPDWYDGKHINEVLFCQQFLEKHPMKCVRGRLFTVDGLIEDEGQIGNLILEEISGVLTANLSKTVANLLASIKLQAYSPPLPIETDRIHVANGTYFMDGSFTADKNYCNNRLTVAYNPDAPTPKKWLQFLSELLQPEDIPTLQEFLGYCLLPTTKGQKMLMLIGKGGEEIKAIEAKLVKMIGKPVDLKIVEVRNTDMNAQLVAENIAQQLEKRIGFRRAMKNAMGRAMRAGARGIKTCCSGRLGGAEIARTEHYHDGTIPLQTLRADIDYGFAEAATTYGRIGVKVWVYKGEVLKSAKNAQKKEGGNK